MKKLLSLVLAVMMIVSVTYITASANATPEIGMVVDYSIQANHDFVEANQISLSYADNALRMTATGSDPYYKFNNAGDNWNSYYAPGTGINLDTYRYVAFCYKSDASATNAMLFSDSTATDNFGNSGTYINFTLETSSTYVIKVLDMKALNPTGWTGNLEGIRFDPAEAKYTGSVYMKWFGLFRSESYARSYSPETKHYVSTDKNTYVLGDTIKVSQAHTGAGDWVNIVPTGTELSISTEASSAYFKSTNRQHFNYANSITLNVANIEPGTYDVVSLLGDNYIEIDRKTITIVEGSVGVSVGSVSGDAGNTVKVPVNISNPGAGMYALNLKASYDDSNLTFTGYENGNVFTAIDESCSQASASDGYVKFLIVSDEGSDNTKSGTLIYLNFTIAANLAEDSTFTIALESAGLGADCINYDGEDVLYEITGSGKITATAAEGFTEITLQSGTTSYFVTYNDINILTVRPNSVGTYGAVYLSDIMDSVNEDEFVKVYNATGVEVTSETARLSTGFTVVLVDAQGNEVAGQSYILSVLGDFDCNGRVNASDYAKIKTVVSAKASGYTITTFIALGEYTEEQFAAANIANGTRINAASYGSVKTFVDTASW